MSKKPDKNSPVTKAKSKKNQERLDKIQNAVTKYVKTTKPINLDELDDTVDNID